MMSLMLKIKSILGIAPEQKKEMVQRRFDNLMFNNNGNLDVVIPLMKEEFNKRPGRH